MGKMAERARVWRGAVEEEERAVGHGALAGRGHAGQPVAVSVARRPYCPIQGLAGLEEGEYQTRAHGIVHIA